VEGFAFVFPFARSKIKKEKHVKGLRTVTCVSLHAFFIQIAARQQKQVQEQKALYHSINSYSEEIVGTVKDLSSLGVLKTAILLHQRQPQMGTNDPTMQKACSAPAIQAKMNTLSPAQLQFDEKLDRLKKVLPFASEVMLASLLTRENGTMNAVVQQILDSGTHEDAEKEVDGSTRVIDLTEEESAKNDPAATQVQNLAKIPVDTNMTQKILETVENQGSVPTCSNLLSFQKLEKSQLSLHGSWVPDENENSARLSETTATSRQRECPYCFRSAEQPGPFCNFCGGVFYKNFADGERVDLI